MKRRLRFEYWPYGIFYIPVYISLLAKAIRSGSPAFFTAANPGMEYGGFVNYSKYRILSRLPEALVPKTIFVDAGQDPEEVIALVQERGIPYPLIAKPDRGERGFGVSVLEDAAGIRSYARRMDGDYLIQELVGHELEFGVLYARHPAKERGAITSVVVKDLPAVTGDGNSTISELIDSSDRLARYRSEFHSVLAARGGEVPGPGERVLLHPIGNHARGARFRDGRDLVGPEVELIFHDLAAALPGFFIGRFDVKASSWEALAAGDFSVIEVNGANSEPAHIYDPDNSLGRAWRDLLAHWDLLCTIATANIARGHAAPATKDLLAAIRAHLGRKKRYAARTTEADSSEVEAAT